jgi:hypothetical protein
MALDSDFIEAVKNRNKRLIRIMLGNIITIDPTSKTFKEMLEYAEQNMDDLFDIHHGELKVNRDAWTKDYYTDQQTELSFNFSRQRLELLCDIAVHLYSDRINAINEEIARKNKENTVKTVGGIAVVGGAVIAVVGAIAKTPIVVGVGIAAAVVGTIILITESKNK